MSLVCTPEHVRKLETVHQLRESRALRAMHVQRPLLASAIALRDKHKAQADKIKQALHELDRQRDSHPAGVSANSLLVAATRRHWLCHDLDQELTLIAEAVSEVEKQQTEYMRLRAVWQQERDHLARLQEIGTLGQAAVRRKSNRVADGLLDEFVATVGVTSHG